MAVRNTESRVPGGFSNASELGLASNDSDSNYALVSYLGETLRYEFGKHPIRNTYVVFVNTATLGVPAANLHYTWQVELFANVIDTVPLTSYSSFDTSHGVFYMNSDDTTIDYTNFSFLPNTDLIGAGYLTVNVKVMNGTTELKSMTIGHFISALRGKVDLLASRHADAGFAYLGAKDIAYMIVNDYRDYILRVISDDVGLYDTDFKMSLNLVAALMFLKLYQTKNAGSSYEWQERIENWELEKVINGELANTDYVKRDMGVCGVRPHVLGMFFSKDSAKWFPPENESGNNFATVREVDTDNISEEAQFNDLSTNLTSDEIIDLYNLLRFPKTNILLCGFLLNQIKRRHPAWISLDAGSLPTSKTCVKTIIGEYTNGLYGTMTRYGSVARAAFGMAWTDYIEEILKPDIVPFRIIKVQVLDIRSGRPIQNARVKELNIFTNVYPGPVVGNILNQEFDYDHDPITEAAVTSDIVNETQRVLWRLGYYPSGTSEATATSGGWGPGTSTAFNAFWADRITTDPPTTTGATQAEEYLMQYVIDEYNGHGFTDDDGALSVRVPSDFLDDQVTIRVGFFEFPIFVERLSNQVLSMVDPSVSRPNTNPTSYQNTGFEISWIDSQDRTWANHTSSNPTTHFGWEVQGAGLLDVVNLKMRQELVVKDTSTSFTSFNVALFSAFYHENTYPYNFVLFGMQWCKPTWHELSADVQGWVADISTSTNNTQMVQAAERTQSAIVSRYNTGGNSAAQGTLDGWGRDYGILIMNPGTYGPRGSTRYHRGVDHYAVEGVTPVFAPHGGKVVELRSTGTSNPSNGYGEKVTINLKGTTRAILLGHLHTTPLVTTRVTQNDIVQAGFNFGTAGRTFDSSGPYTSGPTHLHLEMIQTNSGSSGISSGDVRFNDPKDIIDATDDHSVNRDIYLNNSSNHMMPCDCHWPTGSAWDASVCVLRAGQTSTTIVNACWARRTLHCPYLDDAGNEDYLYQAQLAYLYVNRGTNDYFDPGTLDGNFGTAPMNVAAANLTSGTTVTLLTGGANTAHGGILRRVTYTPSGGGGAVTGWIGTDLLNGSNQLNVASLSNLLDNSVGASRMAIYNFKKVNGLLSYTDYASNFEPDATTATQLNTHAPLNVDP